MKHKKYDREFKLKMIKEYEAGASYYSIEKKYGLPFGTVSVWDDKYKAKGADNLDRHNSMLCRYTAEFKQTVVNDYLAGGGSIRDLSIKYGINGESTVLKWVKQYNNHEELTDSRNIGGPIMADNIKARKTTLDERIQIVEFCITHSNNYALTAKEYNCSYGQVYAWVKKYNTEGVAGPEDRRGRNKSEEELSEIEKLKAENRLLKAEMLKQEMEIALLKKLEEIERR